MTRALAAQCLTLSFAFIAAAACSAGGKAATGIGSTGNGGTGSSLGSGGVVTGGGNNGTGNVQIFGGTSGGGGTTTATMDGCPAIVSRPEQATTTVTLSLPLDMFIMYDQSGSMGTGSNGVTKWDAIKKALTGFVQDPASDGIGVGIQYFPLSVQNTCTAAGPNCLCLGFPPFCFGYVPIGGGSCDVTAYATPDVPIGLLPGVSAAIVSSLNAHGPGGGTPTVPALTGAIQYASQYASTHLGDGGIPYRKTIVVLATDGDPNDCNSSVSGVSAVAAAGLAANPSIQTFVIGVGSSLTSLNAIAAAGGTSQAFIVDPTKTDATAQFEAAMNQIRTVSQQSTTISTPIPCEWTIPPPPAGSTFDKTKVNVSLNSTTVGHVSTTDAGTDACLGVTQNAWYYDSETLPTKVLLCPDTCTAVKAMTTPTIEVAFGCDTVEIIH